MFGLFGAGSKAVIRATGTTGIVITHVTVIGFGLRFGWSFGLRWGFGFWRGLRFGWFAFFFGLFGCRFGPETVFVVTDTSKILQFFLSSCWFGLLGLWWR